jgi:ABC-type antimicrobial peptide transport system permease subunit
MDTVASQVAALDGRVFVDDPQTLAALLQRNLAGRQRMLRLLAIAAAIVLLLTAFSVAGTLGEFVQQRVREIALRKALGASGHHTLLLVCRNIALPAFAGILFGSIGGIWLARAFSSELFGVHPLDALTLSATVLGLAVVGLVSATGPFLRALWVDPADALRVR